MTQFLNITTSFEEGSAIFAALAREPISDRPAFAEIASRLGTDVYGQMTSVTPPNSVETARRKAWGPVRRSGSHGSTGSLTGTLRSSGRALAGLQERSTDVSAAVKRGKDDWWLFLHDRGKGYAYWTVDGRKGRGAKRSKGARDSKRAAERSGGALIYDRRNFMFISSGTQSWALDRITKAVDDGLQRAADGASV